MRYWIQAVIPIALMLAGLLWVGLTHRKPKLSLDDEVALKGIHTPPFEPTTHTTEVEHENR